jgi:glycerate 2-kinase
MHCPKPNGPVQPRDLLKLLFATAIASAQPSRCVPAHLPRAEDLGRGRLIVIGAGKASAAMARAVEDHWTGDPSQLRGLVVTRYGHGVACQHIEIVEAAHPVPDAAGLAAAERMLSMVHGLHADDVVLCLISGGGSSLLPLPLPGLTLAHKQAVNRALLKSGATIREMNCVRRHLSAIKGGRLAAACHPARVVNLLISDVPGDNPMDIASGPTVADPTTCADALAIVRRHGIDLPAEVLRVLQTGRGESVKPDDPRIARVQTHMIATPQMALEAAAAVAQGAGVRAYVLGDAIEGEARDVGKVLGGIALQVAGEADLGDNRRASAPACGRHACGRWRPRWPGPARGAVPGLRSSATRRRGRSGRTAAAGCCGAMPGRGCCTTTCDLAGAAGSGASGDGDHHRRARLGKARGVAQQVGQRALDQRFVHRHVASPSTSQRQAGLVQRAFVELATCARQRPG